MHIHYRKRALRIRIGMIFVGTFILVFTLLNIRFVEKNVQYAIAPGTIRTKETISDAISLLPLSQAVAPKPLGNKARLVIDSIGVNAPIVFGIPDDTDKIYDSLEQGVVHYSVTAKPGAPGTGIVLGHSSAFPWYKGDYGAVFALLNRLKVGDRFYVQYEDNRSFVYEMKSSLIFNPFKADDRLTELERAPGNNLILMSCFPVGTNYLRIAIRAQEVTP